jgi:hypothetical protein
MITPRGASSLFRLPKANYIITPPVRGIFANVLSFSDSQRAICGWRGLAAIFLQNPEVRLLAA